MASLNRRSFLAGSAAVAASPVAAAVPPANLVDVAVIGAGAAGIAAARRLAAAGRRFALIEAAEQAGGRCVTDSRLFGVPFDLGARWIRSPDSNPVAKLAKEAKVEIYPTPPGQKLRIEGRPAREGEMEAFLAAVVRSNRAISDAARGKSDIACNKVLPKDLADWRAPVEFILGPFECGKDLADVSAYDLAKLVDRDVDGFCRQGFGTLLARLSDGLGIQLGNPVARIDFSNRASIDIETAKGTISARAAIITLSTAALVNGPIKFKPLLPKRLLDACAKLPLGSYDHIALELAGNPLGLQSDDLVFEKTNGSRTGALLANIGGSSLCTVDVGGRFGKALAAQGPQAMIAFATDWLASMFGADVKKAVKRSHATQWTKDQWALGAVASAAPGGQPSRRILMEPVDNRIWFAGEAAHETLWGTVGGAWESGERAATEVIKRLARP